MEVCVTMLELLEMCETFWHNHCAEQREHFHMLPNYILINFLWWDQQGCACLEHTDWEYAIERDLCRQGEA